MIIKDTLLMMLGISLVITFAPGYKGNTAASATDPFINPDAPPIVRENGLRAASPGGVNTVVPDDCPPNSPVAAATNEKQELDFLMLGTKFGTDKVQANFRLPTCLTNLACVKAAFGNGAVRGATFTTPCINNAWQSSPTKFFSS
jgi:hypothetical protein